MCDLFLASFTQPNVFYTITFYCWELSSFSFTHLVMEIWIVFLFFFFSLPLWINWLWIFVYGSFVYLLFLRNFIFSLSKYFGMELLYKKQSNCFPNQVFHFKNSHLILSVFIKLAILLLVGMIFQQNNISLWF